MNKNFQAEKNRLTRLELTEKRRKEKRKKGGLVVSVTEPFRKRRRKKAGGTPYCLRKKDIYNN